jgi:hypothetical protein
MSIVMTIASVLELAGLIAAIVAFRAKRKGLGIVLILAMVVLGGAAALFDKSPFDPDAIGRQASRPAAVNTPVSVEDLTLVVKWVKGDINISKTTVATNARKLIFSVQATCELPAGQTCSTSYYIWKVVGPTSTHYLQASERIDRIEGGSTVDIELSTGFILNSESLAGGRLEFVMREHSLSLLRSAYFALGTAKP